ncbi:MAG: hypothetical protein ACE5K0_00925 [Candidatus Methanofastidiosia archaeon]
MKKTKKRRKEDRIQNLKIARKFVNRPPFEFFGANFDKRYEWIKEMMSSYYEIDLNMLSGEIRENIEILFEDT